MEELSCMTLCHISSTDFIIPTKGIVELEKILNTWIKIGSTGAILWGRPRIGKSHALQYIASNLHKKYGSEFPVLIWNLTDHPETERSFYASLLLAMGISVEGNNKTALVLKEKVLNLMAVQACETPYRKIVLFIDEAWKLNHRDFSWLMDLYNNLYISGIQLTCFLCGTRELKDLKTELKTQGQDQIVGRFMVHEIQYYGLRTKNELELCMYSLDKTNMIDTSGKERNIRVLDFYFPHASGQSFCTLSNTYWEAFQQVRMSHSVRAKDIPMKYLIDSFNILLDTYGVVGFSPVAFPTLDEIVSSIELSGYGESDDEYEIRKRR